MVQPVTGFPGVTLETDVRCRLRDGVELLADVYRPDAAGGPYPVLLQRVPAGARLRIDVTSSDFPLWARNSNSGYPGDGVPRLATQTVLHTAEYPSHLTLPMLPARRP